uniref:CKAP2_C domain-containing protein n=1 Tax=Steinernema glaseri TaxID=37863 RepID=A0A1I7YCL5_9BILA
MANGSRKKVKEAPRKQNAKKMPTTPRRQSKSSGMSCCVKKSKRRERHPRGSQPFVHSRPRATLQVTKANGHRSRSLKPTHSPATKLKGRSKKVPAATEAAKSKKHISDDSIRAKANPENVTQSVQPEMKAKEDTKKKRREKVPAMTALSRNTKNMNPIYPMESLHVFSVMHDGRMITRWKFREAKPREGATQNVKSKKAILLTTQQNTVKKAPTSESDLTSNTASNSMTDISTECPYQNQVPVTHEDSSCSRKNLPYSINSFSSLTSQASAREEGKGCPKTLKCGRKSPGKLSAETSVEMPSLRRTKTCQPRKKKLDAALIACEQSIHHVGSTLKGLKTLAGNQLIPEVTDFENKIDTMFTDMDRVLEWIAVISEKAEYSH